MTSAQNAIREFSLAILKSTGNNPAIGYQINWTLNLNRHTNTVGLTGELLHFDGRRQKDVAKIITKVGVSFISTDIKLKAFGFQTAENRLNFNDAQAVEELMSFLQTCLLRLWGGAPEQIEQTRPKLHFISDLDLNDLNDQGEAL